MKEFILKNIEKVLLAFLLVVLAVCAVYKIWTLKKVVVERPTPIGDESAGVDPVPDLLIRMVELAELSKKPYNGTDYIYCRALACKHIIKKGSPRCQMCNTSTKINPVVSKKDSDRDEDGIPNDDEIKVGLNPDDANDALRDMDKDGFSNLDEYRYNTAINDKSVHPAVINRCSLLKPRKDYYPMIFTEIVVNNEEDPKSKWDIYLTEYGKRVSQRIRRVNESLEEVAYKIIDVDKNEQGKYFVVLKKADEEPVTLMISRGRKVKRVKYPIVNKLNKNVYAYIGASFVLKNKDGKEETYKAVSYDPRKKLLKVIDEQLKEEVFLGIQAVMNEPLADDEMKKDMESGGDLHEFELRLPRRRK